MSKHVKQIFTLGKAEKKEDAAVAAQHEAAAQAAAARQQQSRDALLGRAKDMAELKDVMRSKAQGAGATRLENDAVDVLGSTAIAGPKRKSAARVLLG